MKIESKFSINDLVWVMEDGRPRQLKVKQVEVRIDCWWSRPKQEERYFLASGVTAFCFHEWFALKNIFSTKEELLASL